jgi:hypothetical protein
MQRPISRATASVLAALVAMTFAACARKFVVPSARPTVSIVAVPVEKSCTPAGERAVGEGRVVGNLVVYPIASCAQADAGEIVTLDEALARGWASVREIEGGGSVNTLVIENKGSVPVFVLAGTILRGGKQDRQIGQDYIIGAKEKTDVDAFCVEHGRWDEKRDGKKTNGEFRVADVIATSKVRAAGQYEKDQGKVWSKVAATNKAHNKKPASDTLLASVDDATLMKEREALAARLEEALSSVASRESVIGFAYAIDGEIRGARWFAHHKLYAMHEKKLLRSIALEGATASAEAKASGKLPPKVDAPPPPSVVETFIASVDKEDVKEERETKAENVNEYKESAKAYGSSTKFKSKPGAVGKSASKKPLSSDVTAK